MAAAMAAPLRKRQVLVIVGIIIFGNLFGAIERPTAKQLLKRARKHAPEARAESSESAA